MRFQFGRRWNMAELSGKIVARTVKELGEVSSAAAAVARPEKGEANEISVGAMSNAPRETLALMAPIFTGDGSDDPVSLPPVLEKAPCMSCSGHPPRVASTPSFPANSRFPGTPGRSARYHARISAKPTVDELMRNSGRKPRVQSNSPAPCKCEFGISTRNFGTCVRASPKRQAASKERFAAGSVPRPGSLQPWNPVRRAPPEIDH